MHTNERILLTPEGKQELEEELVTLRKVKLPALRKRVHELTEAGDVSDDSDYEGTKEELVQLEWRINELETMLEDAVVVENEGSDGTVAFGSRVSVVDSDGEEDTWTIVGPHEANASVGRISNVSPVGSALMGKRVGDKVTVHAPGGDLEFEVKEIQ